jgi:hypothetical protein
MERSMTKSRKVLLALASAISMTALIPTAFAQYYPAQPYNDAAVRFAERGAPVSARPDWWRRWQLRRLYSEPQGYVPDSRGCTPGACRDNPNY